MSAAVLTACEGSVATAKRLVVEFFDSRGEPAFFLHCSNMPQMLTRLNSYTGQYIERLAATVQEMTETAYKVYSITSAPLRPGFPWVGQHPNAPKDILYDAQPHRFSFAPMLALAVTAKRFSASAFLALLEDWADFVNSGASTISFVSTLVVMQRVIACSWAYVFLGDSRESADESLISLKWYLLKIIRSDIEFLTPRLGNSYPNNHLLLDRFACWYVIACYPEFVDSAATLKEVEHVWLEEVQRQTYPDGGYFEPSMHYHKLATEAAAGYYLLSERQGRPVPQWFHERLERMLRFQADLAGSDGCAPRLGDFTEDALFPLAARGTSSSALRVLYSKLYNSATRSQARGPDALCWTYWITGGTPGINSFEEEHSFTMYPDVGICIARDEPLSRYIFRLGPSTTVNVMPGHMHSDLLSICLVEHGVPLIVDAGTYSYRHRMPIHSGPQINWRSYFTSVHAHNTLQIDSEDPLEPLNSDFRASATPVPRIHKLLYGASNRFAFAEGTLSAIGVYNGFTRGILIVHGDYAVIWNIVPAAAHHHRAQFRFQLAPQTTVTAVHEGFLLEKQQASIKLCYSDGLHPEAPLTGSFLPLGGWFSPAYGDLVPAPQLQFTIERKSVLTGFCVHSRNRPEMTELTCELISNGSRIVHVRGNDYKDLILVSSPNNEIEQITELQKVLYSGKALWVRKYDSGHMSFCAHGCTKLQLEDYDIDLTFPVAQDITQ